MLDNLMPNATQAMEFHKQMFASFGQFGEIAAEAQRKLAAQQMTALEANIGAATKLWDAVAEGKKPAELLAVQMEATQSLSEKLMVVAKDSLDTQIEARDKMAKAWTDAVSTEAKKPAKKTA